MTAVAVLLLPFLASPALAEPTVLVMDAEIMDTSGEGASPEHPRRLQAITRTIEQGFAESGRFSMVEAPVPPPGEPPPRIRTCNGCEVDIARKAGADLVVTGLVHKVSTLILSVTIEIKDASSGQTGVMVTADIRGDNERSWVRGTEWLMRHRILPVRYPGEG